MSENFIYDLGLPEPDINLGIGSGTHAEQTAGVMVAYENYLMTNTSPDWIIVVGDVNSTMACTLTAKKLNLKVAHLEAGLRSFDRTMPEEINRIVTDALSDILWTPSQDADENLKNEGIDASKIKRVGNIMIDSFLMLKNKIDIQSHWKDFGSKAGEFGVVTLHRPANVDKKENLACITRQLVSISDKLRLVLPLHPRTKKKLSKFNLMNRLKKATGILIVEPMGYIEFMGLLSNAFLAITDSGGLQEETTFMKKPCLTVRENTERPITCTLGTNRLVSLNGIENNFEDVIAGKWKEGVIPELWDGRSAQRVVQDLLAKEKML